MKIVVMGMGKMGSWLATSFRKGNDVAVYDIDSKKAREAKGCKILASPGGIEEFQPDLLINSVDLKNTVKAFNEVVSFLPEECILADISSIKGDLPNYYRNSKRRFVSTHPMFGPTNASMSLPVGESSIIIRESDESGKKIFSELYREMGLNVYEFSFDEHDSMMAYSLTLPFSSSMVFAACVDTKAVPGTNFKKHMELAKGLLSEDDGLLSEILFNPRSIAQIEKITSRLELLKHIIRDRDYEEAGKFFEKLRDNISN